MTAKRRRWLGGYVHRQKDGADLFIIEREVGGRRFHVSTKCHSERAALKQLERFEADPFSYAPEGEDRRVVFDDELVSEFLRFLTSKERSPKYVREVGKRLADWLERFGGRDLRALSTRDDLRPALERWPGKKARIIALKSFYSWLRREKHLVKTAEDPSLDISVPQAQPEKARRRKVVSFDQVKGAARFLPLEYRDCLEVLMATAWHVTELERFVRLPDSELIETPAPVRKRTGAIAVLVVRHKTKVMTRTPLRHPRHLAAAKRLRERGTIPRRLNTVLREACRKAQVQEFTLGVMRHTVSTWAVESGADPAQVAHFLEHRDPRTTMRFYVDVAVPKAAVPVKRLAARDLTVDSATLES